MKLLSIIKKNFLIIVSSKVSLILLLLGPVLLMLLVGIGLSDSGLRNVPAVVYSESQTPFVDSFIEAMRIYSFIPEFSGSLQECIEMVRTGKRSVCIELDKNEVNVPPGLGVSRQDIENVGIGYSVRVHADFSKPRVVWGIIAKVERVVNLFSEKVRSFSEEKFREKTGRFSREIENLPRILDDVEGAISSARFAASQIRVKIPSSESVDRLLEEINYLEYQVRVLSSLLGGNYSSEIQDILTSINTLASLADKATVADPDSIISSLKKIDRELLSAKRDVKNVKRKLSSLERDSKDISKLKWEYVANPIPMSYRELSGKQVQESGQQLGFFDYLFPSFVSFFILLISIFLSTIMIVKDRNSNAHVRNVLSKAPRFSFILAGYLTSLIIISVQVILLLLVANIFLNIPILSSPLNVFATLFLSISIFILIGMLIAYLVSSSEMAMILAISISLIMIVFSSLITPRETLPEFLKTIVSNTPLVISESLLRKTLIFETGITKSASQIGILTAIFVLVFVLILFASKRVRKKEEEG